MKRLLLSLALLLCLVPAANAAIAFVAQASTSGTTATTLTLAAFAPGADNYTVAITGMAAGSVGTVTGVTCNGVAMAQLWTVVRTGNYRNDGWGKAGCATGDIVATFSAAQSEVFLGAVSYSGVHQTVSTGTAATSSGVTNPATVTVDVTSAADEVVVDGALILDTTVTAGTGQTGRFSIASATYALVSSSETGAATTTMSWTDVGSGVDWVMGGVALKPAAVAGGGAGKTLSLLGVE